MSIELENLTKLYDGTPVVDDVSLTIPTGELFVLLGPSGSGKSTLLRMIAGLAEVDAGRVRLHGRDVTEVSPKDRGLGFVFQHYALFRHMRVADNVEFALRVRGMHAADRKRRREDLLQLVGLSGFAQRFPDQLSGGQQQRVALARALAHEPAVLLLDEPFGALDARIRLELRQALRRIQRELGLTSVFVTHDQEEAFALADRLGVMHHGSLLEVGPPRELYLRPRSPFVATFLGAANLLVGESVHRAVRLGDVELPVATELSGTGPRRVQVLFRPEDVELSAPVSGAAGAAVAEAPGRGNGRPARLGRGVVEEQAFVGAFERLRVRLAPLSRVRPVAPVPLFGSDRLWVEAVRPQHEAAHLPLGPGAAVEVGVRRFHLLAPASLRFVTERGDGAAARAASRLAAELASRVGGELGGLGPLDNGGPPADALGAETESGAEGFDVAVLALEPQRPGRRGAAGLALARHHLLLVPGPSAVPSRFLICVAVGEPGKADVRFAERLAWQLGAEATVLTVLPETRGATPPHVERFLAACERTLSTRGVVTCSRVRRGPVLREIRAELAEGDHDLLVVGAPVEGATPRHPGPAELEGLVERLLEDPPPCPVLVVRGQARA